MESDQVLQESKEDITKPLRQIITHSNIHS